MRKRKVQWLAAACVFCLAQPVWAATESTTVYQDQLDSVDQSYLGEISKASTPDNSNIRVVRRGEKAKSAQPTEQLPTRIDADKMSYTGSTGDVYAQGDVVVTQGNQTLMSPRIEGNTKTTEYRTVGGYRFLENGGKSKDITGQNMTYRTSDHHFTADQAFGWNDPYYVKGQNATFDGETGHMEKGMVTTKHAMAFKHTPDYRV
ncbi:MAG: LptA/OstA family protein, partial [Anaerococcus hydrogenalis]